MSCRNALAACEREVVCTIADDEDNWTIYSDSVRFTRRLLKVAERWSIAPERLGSGYAFALPRAAIRFVAPQRVTNKESDRRKRLREAFRNRPSGANRPISIGALAARRPRPEYPRPSDEKSSATEMRDILVHRVALPGDGAK